jgi:hypothetical protein
MVKSVGDSRAGGASFTVVAVNGATVAAPLSTLAVSACGGIE